MDRLIRVGIVGAGNMCDCCHLPVLEAMDNVEVAAICDIVRDKAQYQADLRCAKAPLIFEDYHELLKVPGLDAVFVLTPNYLHSVIAVDALDAGLNVFCEKPDAVSVEEVLKMQAAAERSGKTLMVMRNNRYTSASRYIKEYISSGRAGEIYCGRCGWVRRRGIPGKGGWFTTKEQSGGGPLIDLGVHMIDLAIWLMGNPTPVAVSGSTFRKFADDGSVSDSEHTKFGEAVDEGVFDVEDLAMGFIKFAGGTCLQLEFSWASNIREETNFVELRGEKAGFTWRGGEVSVYTSDGPYLVDQKPACDWDNNGHVNNIHHFIAVLEGREEPRFVPQQGVDMIKILTALYESARTGREIVL